MVVRAFGVTMVALCTGMLVGIGIGSGSRTGFLIGFGRFRLDLVRLPRVLRHCTGNEAQEKEEHGKAHDEGTVLRHSGKMLL